VAAGAAALGKLPGPAPSLLAADQAVYTDALGTGWANWSWNTTVNLSNPSPVHQGSASIAATYTAAWAGLYLHVSPSLSGADFASLRFFIHGGSAGGQRLNLVYDGSGSAGPAVAVTPPLDVTLVGVSGTPTPTPTPDQGPALSIDAAAARHPISPDIYGMNFADEALA